MNLNREKFEDVDLSDAFFDSLKADYQEFSDWFSKKADNYAYVFRGASGQIDGFLYLKTEDGPLIEVNPPLQAAKRIKVGTFKINAHGTKLGERFVKKIFDHAIYEKADEIYVTVFEKHASLLSLLEKYGFRRKAEKQTQNGNELVLVKRLDAVSTEILENYPVVKLSDKNIYLLSLYPIWHTRLLPDSILTNENAEVVQDVSHTNSIHKVYLAKMSGMQMLQKGDILLVYRTTDNQGPARYRSVATSVGVIEEYKNIQSFPGESEFLKYCRPYSVFTEEELKRFWRTKEYPHVVRFTYNFALQKRVTRGIMIDDIGISESSYWGFMQISSAQFCSILSAGEVNESLVVN
jgi:L-amino acid N-acyltransferase YncA